MTPFLFGPPTRQLFGLYHEPESGRPAGTAVLVCPPYGQEAIRSHRLFRVLADRLARGGTPVLRFDYFGTGDSPGDDVDGEFDGWRQDVCAAHEELRRRAGGRRIVWLGARLGATLAALAAAGGRCDPARLLLWDPVVAGSTYLEQLRHAHVEALERSFCIPDPHWRRQLSRDPEAFTSEALGFEIAPALLRQLRALTPKTLPLTALHDTRVLAPEEDREARHWFEEQAERRLPVRFETFKHPLIWASDPHPNNAMVPAEVLQRLLSAINE